MSDLFNPEELLTLSEILYSQDVDRCKIRTIFNRAYYCCFLKMKEKCGKTKADDRVEHYKIWEKISSKDNKLSSKLAELWIHRRFADYSLEKEEKISDRNTNLKVEATESEAKDVIETAKSALNDIENFNFSSINI